MAEGLDRGIEAAHRGIDIAFEALWATVFHVRRLVGVLADSAGRLVHEVGDLAADYHDVAGAEHRHDRHTDPSPRVRSAGTGRHIRVVR